jgi:ribosomal protein S18 acetylase RimI-like enzyme
LGEHCLDEARRLGYCAIQFKFMGSTNEVAVNLWERLGFTVLGSLPGAFRHPPHGCVDVDFVFRMLP